MGNTGIGNNGTITVDPDTGVISGIYAIDAHVTYRTPDGWAGSRDLPTFYLHPNVQGITGTEHAERIALGMLAEVVTACAAAIGVPDTFASEGTPVKVHVTAYRT